MTPRWLGVVLGALLLTGGMLGCGGAGTPERIVLIVVDTLRRDHLSCYGGGTPTPRIDALAARGQRVRNAFSSFHQTTMSMGALFSGLTPSLEIGNGRSIRWTGRSWCGLTRFADPAGEQGCIPQAVATLPERLREAGYWTAGVVTNPLLFRPAGFERGFERWLELEDPHAVPRRLLRNYRRAPAADQVNVRVRELLEDRPSDRFFLYVHYMDVHDYLLWARPYAQMVERVDVAVGELLDWMRSRGLLDDALIVLTSDHGERLAEPHFVKGKPSHRGDPSFEEVLQVPLIVWPARFGAGDALLRGADVHHQILELAGAASSPEAELEPGELFLSEKEWQTYRREQWKSYHPRGGKRVHLVDLSRDPGERQDVAQRFPEIVARHRARLAELTRSLGARAAPVDTLTPEDRRRLEALGYLD